MVSKPNQLVNPIGVPIGDCPAIAIQKLGQCGLGRGIWQRMDKALAFNR
ncbi:hypothetical protein [Spirosoma endophyticum]|nr:hypothetical protein [Spirosoma endophyticum]